MKARESETLKQGSMIVEEYDTKFNWLATYASYMLLDEREKIRRFVLGLRLSLRQFVKLQMETYSSFSAVVDGQVGRDGWEGRQRWAEEEEEAWTRWDVLRL